MSGFNAAHPLDSWHGDAGWLPLVATIDGSSVIVVGDVREDGPSPSFDLLRLGLSGDTLLRRSVPYEPTPVTRAERAWLTDGFSAAMAGDYLSGPGLPTSDSQRERMRRDARDAITFPENHPPVRQIVAGQDGSIWLLREFALPDLVDRWEIYDSEGSLEGTVLIRGGRSLVEPWQPRLNVHRATRDEIWGTTIDDLEVPYIHRYRVDRSCPS